MKVLEVSFKIRKSVIFLCSCYHWIWNLKTVNFVKIWETQCHKCIRHLEDQHYFLATNYGQKQELMRGDWYKQKYFFWWYVVHSSHTDTFLFSKLAQNNTYYLHQESSCPQKMICARLNLHWASMELHPLFLENLSLFGLPLY